MLYLQFGFSFADLYDLVGLTKIDEKFTAGLSIKNPALYDKLIVARTKDLPSLEESQIIIDLAPYVEEFISELFDIKTDIDILKSYHLEQQYIAKCKKNFVQRRVAKHIKLNNQEITEQAELATQELVNAGLDLLDEISVAKQILLWIEMQNEQMLKFAELYVAWALFTEEGKNKHKESILFKLPKKIDPNNLLLTQKDEETGIRYFSDHRQRIREGFVLHNQDLTLPRAVDNAHYCIHCHNQQKDSCSKGLKDKNTGQFLVNDHNVTLIGCPLEEKISEMNYLKAKGYVIASFATAVIDNPMLAATGHRICNDCMKSCIYQKQEPVDIPIVETQILEDVLNLPWGFEIYSLLTRWNPLNFKNYLPKPLRQHKILIAGLGPAGFTLAHYLLNEGFIVVGIDGLKIEPLAEEISGISINGTRTEFQPIKKIKELFEELDKRTAAGFGGVAEYGITIRWNKNYLKIIRLLLERRHNFRMYGSTRFGSTITRQIACKLGFDHIALALGAGKPNLPVMPNILSKGVRMASDFLMALQLTGAGRMDTISNLQIQLPIVIIGSGLTAIDTATESLAYYCVQVEKFLQRYEIMGKVIMNDLDGQEKIVAEEFIRHANQLRAYPERRSQLLKEWGGVTILSRKTLQESSCYKLNHEEVEKAFAEGIMFLENIIPSAIEVDLYDQCIGVLDQTGKLIVAKTVLIAIGTVPNTVLAEEDSDYFLLNNKYFQLYNQNNDKIEPEYLAKPTNTYVLSNLGTQENDISVSCFGDLHPSYAGNVVKAMASAKNGYKSIVQILQHSSCNSQLSHQMFFKMLDEKIIAKVSKIERLTSDIVEVVIHAPLAASLFQPGQFYRLQNYEANAIRKSGTTLSMEGLALTGECVNKEQGLLSMIVLEMGGSTNLCAYLKEGEIVALMGPTGTPTEIPKNETVMLIGGGLGNAVLISIGKAMRTNNCKVLYFAGYKRAVDRYKTTEIEEAADIVVWCCDELVISKNRPQDKTLCANIIEAIEIYGNKITRNNDIKLSDIDRMIVIGSDKMMAAVAYARHNKLKYLFKESHIAIGSINSPMQCMMKGICAQCLQEHIHPITKEKSYIYSCYKQDQDLDCVNFSNLSTRLMQNSLQEKIAKQWIYNVLNPINGE